MAHSDDNGLVLPPSVAPIDVAIVPIYKTGVQLEEIRRHVTPLAEELRKRGFTVKIDDNDTKKPGWKFAEYEMKGVPLRLEIGPRDIENNCCVLVRRDNGEKTVVSLDEIETKVPELLKAVHDGLLEKGKKRREQMTFDAHNMEEMKDIADNHPGFVRAMWCGDLACEEKIKEDAGLTSRCIPFEQEEISDKCVCCGKPAKHMLYWGKQY